MEYGISAFFSKTTNYHNINIKAALRVIFLQGCFFLGIVNMEEVEVEKLCKF